MQHFYNKISKINNFTYSKLYKDMVCRFSDNSKFVEIGSFEGVSTCFLAVEIINSQKNIEFSCVDVWRHMESENMPKHLFKDLYERFLKNIEPIKQYVFPIREVSWEAASFFENQSLDFVFIDASHDYTSVSQDLQAWYPKVKKTGVLAGHDYTPPFPGLRQAVDEFFKKTEHRINLREDCWVVDLTEKEVSFT